MIQTEDSYQTHVNIEENTNDAADLLDVISEKMNELTAVIIAGLIVVSTILSLILFNL